MTPDDLLTDRLRLVLIPVAALAAFRSGDLAAVAAAMPGLPPMPATVLLATEHAHHVLDLRLAQLAAHPAEAPWLLRLMVTRGPSPEVVGYLGFHAPPDADGAVEIGYEVHADRRRAGLASEAAHAMVDAATTAGARAVLASVSPDNAASLALVRRLGFVHTGEQVDEIDGLEFVHTLALPPPG